MYTIDNLCSRVDLDHPIEGKQFEKYFYTAFNKLKDQRLIRQFWYWNDEQQTIRFKIPNEHVAIYTYKNELDQNTVYVGGIYDRRFSQFEQIGFQVPQKTKDYAEIITLFSTSHFDGNLYHIEKAFLKEYCYEEARQHGCKSVIATCSPLLLKLYLKWNFKIIDTRNMEAGIRHLIQLDL